MSTSQLPLYIGRTIDVLAFRGGVRYGDNLLTQSLADATNSGEICTGLQKLAQRFLIVLLTEKGSVKYFPDQGTNFMIALAQGRVHNETDMRAVFGLAMQELASQMLDDETDTDPDDERFSGAELRAILVQPGYVNLTIAIASRDDAATIILPIPIVV
jgi:hypothetical protein